jgi:hypothetical protein
MMDVPASRTVILMVNRSPSKMPLFVAFGCDFGEFDKKVTEFDARQFR